LEFVSILGEFKWRYRVGIGFMGKEKEERVISLFFIRCGVAMGGEKAKLVNYY
jgi:hypothetical protein